VLLLGAAYKKDIDDLRESPVLKIIEHLEKAQADVIYNDPYIPQFDHNGKHYESVDLTDELLENVDIAVVTTDHSCYDYQKIVDKARAVFDTRNATKGLKLHKENVYKL
jgi:UDP-N-acetyl-D-glucosamine dehydrogenase